jgi:putative DNA primase/helicase
MGLLDHVIDTATADGERDRARQIDEVRALLAHPRDAWTTDDHNRRVWTKAPKKTAANLRTILTHDPAFRARLRLNEFAGVIEWDGRLMEDADATDVRLLIADLYRVEFSVSVTHEMMVYAARQFSYHPVREWLDGLRWDGVNRMDGLLSTYAGCEASPLHATLSRRFMISCVARIFQPGCKVDTVLILAGPQGYGKSTFFRALAGADWFRDSAIDLRNKDAYMQLRGAWVYEMAELAAMRPRDAETVKAFLSAQVDHYRPPYGRNQVEQKRQSVFVGTTNEPSFLSDPTGARRFWPATVQRMPAVAAVERDRAQLWAEAVVAYKAHERWWLELNETAALDDSQEQYRHEDPWAPKIERWLSSRPMPDGFTVEDVLNDAIEKDGDKQHKGDEMRIGGILGSMGYQRRRVQRDGRRTMRWFPAG